VDQWVWERVQVGWVSGGGGMCGSAGRNGRECCRGWVGMLEVIRKNAEGIGMMECLTEIGRSQEGLGGSAEGLGGMQKCGVQC
jgi:hypothetical protein